MNKIERILSLDREDMSDFERDLFLSDLKKSATNISKATKSPPSK